MDVSLFKLIGLFQVLLSSPTLAVTPTPSPGGSVCKGKERHSVAGKGVCYSFHSNAHSWPRAEYECNKKGGHLASISSDAEQQVVSRALSTEYPSLSKLWIGGKRYLNGWRWLKANVRFEPTELGCFAFDATLRGGFEYKFGNLNSFTFRACLERCRYDEKPIAAVMNGMKCFCGSTHLGLARAADSKCSVPCTGDIQRRCGGLHDAWFLYQVKDGVTNWAPGKPTTRVNPGERCAVVDPAFQYRWRDVDCGLPYHALCQFANGTVMNPYVMGRSFYQARNICLKSGADLASANQRGHYEELYNFVYANKIVDIFWIGATNHEWAWSGGDPDPKTTYWGAGTEFFPQSSELCIEVRKEANNISPFMWHRKACVTPRPFVCRYDEAKPVDASKLTPPPTRPPFGFTSAVPLSNTSALVPGHVRSGGADGKALTTTLSPEQANSTGPDLAFTTVLLIILIILLSLLFCCCCWFAAVVLFKRITKKGKDEKPLDGSGSTTLSVSSQSSPIFVNDSLNNSKAFRTLYNFQKSSNITQTQRYMLSILIFDIQQQGNSAGHVMDAPTFTRHKKDIFFAQSRPNSLNLSAGDENALNNMKLKKFSEEGRMSPDSLQQQQTTQSRTSQTLPSRPHHTKGTAAADDYEPVLGGVAASANGAVANGHIPAISASVSNGAAGIAHEDMYEDEVYSFTPAVKLTDTILSAKSTALSTSNLNIT